MELGFLQETKSILKSLVVSSPNGMTLERLNRDYRDVVGNWIPFRKLGFANLELFLRSIPDTLVVTGYGLQARVGFVTNEKVNHINEMVSRQKNTTRERKQVTPHTLIQPPQYNCKEQLLNAYCGFNKSSNNVHNQNQFIHNSSKWYQKDSNTKYEDNGHRYKTFENSNVENLQISESKSNLCFKHFDYKPEIEHKKLDSSNLGDQSVSQINASQKNVDNHQEISCLLSTSYGSNVLGRKTLNESVLKNETIIHQILECDNNKQEQDCDSTRTSSDHKTIVTEKDNIASSNSIVFPCKSNLPTTNIQNTKKNEQMQNEFEAINPFSQIDATESNDIDEAVPEFAANGLVFRVDFPEHTVGFGQKIPRVKLPVELVKGAVIGVFISEIHSPYKFWFHIYKENHELDTLMSRIELFYSRLPLDELVIPRNCLAPGHVCAALYNEMWHRAEVLTNVCNNKVKVIFFDYGTVSEIEIRNIKYLPEIFSHTPMQAIRGSLSHIKPVSSLWSRTAVRAFLSMVSEILLYAQIMDIDEKDQTVYMVLCDTNGNQTLQINKQMVDKGYAKLDSEWDENKISKV